MTTLTPPLSPAALPDTITTTKGDHDDYGTEKARPLHRLEASSGN